MEPEAKEVGKWKRTHTHNHKKGKQRKKTTVSEKIIVASKFIYSVKRATMCSSKSSVDIED